LIGSVLILATGASSAGASVAIGQLAPGSPPGSSCSGTDTDFFQQTVTSGNTYVVPSTGGVTAWTLTSWSTNASPGGGRYTMKVFRQVAGLTYMAVGHEGPHTLSVGVLNTFPANVAVRAGDILGFFEGGGISNACTFSASAGDSDLQRGGNLADGESGDFISNPGNRMNISALVTPVNTFTLRATTRNKKRGTATLNLNLPNPGDLTASGKDAKFASASRAVISKAVGAGPAQLLIKAKGQQRATLSATGRVKLKVSIVYTPTGGDPDTQSIKVMLKKKL
jgi:hypothetical protein